jgi:hypothetical protein
MKRWFASFVAFAFSFALISSAAAAEYYFSVDSETVNVYFNSDGSASIDYVLALTNQPGAHVIDLVDIGMPNGSFDWNSITVDIDGHPGSVSSDYWGEGSGFAADLGSYAIQPGASGRLRVYVARVENVLYPDSDDDTYASAVFSPSWFGSQYISGSTDLTVIFHLPPGVKPEEPKYHYPSSNWNGSQEPATYLDTNGNVTYEWNAFANAYTQYKFGASFPKQYVPAETIGVTPSFTEQININGDDVFGFCCMGIFALLFFSTPIIGVAQDRKRKMQYMPPKISIEGHGIKRGLTAVEAAVLMETPLDKVMTMILFGVIKKGAAQVESRDPLELSVADPIPVGLREYEKDFVAAFNSKDTRIRKRELQALTVKLVKAVGENMKGFSRKETIAYYKAINDKAWAQIQAAGTPEIQSKMYEEAIEWTMLDKNYDDRARDVFRGPIIVPTWWGRYDPVYRRSITPTTSAGGGGGWAMTGTQGSMPSMPRLPGSDFAASVVNGAQNFSSKVIGDLSSFTQGVTNVTNPPPPPPKSSGGRRSGGGCACACACAGCACACAGGGR